MLGQGRGCAEEMPTGDLRELWQEPQQLYTGHGYEVGVGACGDLQMGEIIIATKPPRHPGLTRTAAFIGEVWVDEAALFLPLSGSLWLAHKSDKEEEAGLCVGLWALSHGGVVVMWQGCLLKWKS